jgi:hypothetical protein
VGGGGVRRGRKGSGEGVRGLARQWLTNFVFRSECGDGDGCSVGGHTQGMLQVTTEHTSVCCLLPAVCCLLSAICCLLSAVFYLLRALLSALCNLFL